MPWPADPSWEPLHFLSQAVTGFIAHYVGDMFQQTMQLGILLTDTILPVTILIFSHISLSGESPIKMGL